MENRFNYAFDKTNATSSKFGVEVVMVIIITLVTWVSDYFDFLNLNIFIQQDIIVYLIYLTISLVALYLLMFAKNIIFIGNNIALITDESVPIGVKTEKSGTEVFLLKPIRLIVKNNLNKIIDNFHASLEDINKIEIVDGAFSEITVLEFTRAKTKGIEPRLILAQQNVSDDKCNITIDKKSENTAIEIASFRVPFKDMFNEQILNGNIGIYFCNTIGASFTMPIGLYSLYIRIDGRIDGREFTRYFNGYLYIYSEKYFNEKYIVTKFREGDFREDKNLIKEVKNQ